MKSIFLLLFIIISGALTAQNYNISNSSDTTCSGYFYDSGGSTGNYGTDENYVQTFVSGNGQRMKLNFIMFNLDDYDYLEIYDGPSMSYPKIGQYRYSDTPGLIVASGNALTIKFYSNYSTYNVGPGWEAQISCAGPVLPVINMDNQTDTIHEAMFYDHEGADSYYASYSDYTHTFYADTADYLRAEFNQLGVGISSGDTLWMYDGADTTAPLLGVYVTGSHIETRTSSGNALTFRFSSDHTSTSRGWQCKIQETNTLAASNIYYDMSPGQRYVCSGIFRDHNGGSNYGTDQNMIQTFTSYNGNRLEFNFNSFSLGNYDYLEVYDGPSTAYPKLGKYYGNSSPGTIQSSGESLTFKFYSNYSGTTVGPGWEAQISCAGPVLPVINMDNQTDTIHEVMFYDHEGADSYYASYSDYTHTFYADTGQYLKAEFNQLGVGISSGDTLWMYDGADTTAPLLGVYVTGSNIETRTSSGKAQTFRFSSDHTSTSRGWQAKIQETNTPAASNIYYDMSPGQRYVCSGIFRDHNGGSNYGTDQNMIQTFTSYNGNRLEFNFNSFSLGNYDYLEVYDGPSTAYPKLGKYYGSSSPGTIQSSGESLTFKFYSNYSTGSLGPGWEAQISCAGPVLPVINMDNQTDTIHEAMFYDNEGADSYYASYSDYTHTFYADTGQYLKAEFNQLGVGISSGDTLWLYDGADTTAPLLGVYVTGSHIESRTSSGKALTFRFSSDHTSTSRGWQAKIQETNTPAVSNIYYDMSPGQRYVCSGIFRDHNGGSNYGTDQNMIQTFTSYNGNRLEFNFNSFSLGNYDYLEIYDGPSTAYPKLGKYYGSSSPGTIKSSGESLTFKFYSNYSTGSLGPGWEAQISCAGPVLPVINMDNQTDTIHEAMFYDHEGADSYYASYSDYTHTFYADTADYIHVEFNPLHASLSNGDTLWIYDGASVQDQLIGIFVKGSVYEGFTSSTNALTFRFKSNYTDVYTGWQARLTGTNQTGSPVNYRLSSGVRYTCDGFFRDHNGTGNYSNDEDYIQTYIARDGQRLKVNFASFQTYHSYDYLKVYDGLNTSSNLIGTYAGSSNPGTIIASDSALTFKFHSNYNYTSSGWEAQFSCINIDPPVIIQQPQNQQVCIDDSVVFTIQAAGGDTLEYQWKKNGIVIPGESDSILVIDSVKNSDAANYYCVVVNPYGVDSTQTVTLTVNPLPQVNFSLTAICAENTMYNLTGGSPAGGTYSGTYVNNGSFDRATSGPGDFIIHYTYTGSNGCASTVQDTLHINALPTISFNSIPGLCENDSPVTLDYATPAGGIYYGNGISSGVFNPAIAGTGVHTVYYTYTDSLGCSADAQQTIEVFATPQVSQSSFSSVCVNSSAFQLSGGTPAGGTYSGPGISNNIFDPSSAGVGIHPIVYTYMNPNGCQGQEVSMLEVYSAPPVSFNLPSTICIDNGPLALNGGSPAGGTYSGSGVINGVFYPSVADTGLHMLTYTYTDSNLCSSSISHTIEVKPLPAVNLDTLPPVCNNENSFALSGGVPVGGTYSGTSIVNGYFYPQIAGPGNHSIMYTYTDNYGCSASDNELITVNPAPSVNILNTDSFYCAYDTLIALNATPAGGVYSGTGVNGAGFNPFLSTPGANYIVYSYSDANGCHAKDSIMMTVHGLPDVDLGTDTAIGLSKSVILDIGSGYQSHLWYNSAVAQKISFYADSAGVGFHDVWVKVWDSNNCTNTDTLVINVFDDTGIEEATENLVKVFPNPFKDIIYLRFAQSVDAEVSIINMQGKLMKQEFINHDEQTAIEVARLKPAAYILRIQLKDRVINARIIKVD